MSGARMMFAHAGPAFAGPNGMPPWPVAVAGDGVESLRSRTSVSMMLSVTFHALLLVWIVLAPKPQPGSPPLTEVTLMDPGSPDGSPAPAAPAAAPLTAPGVVASHSADEHFRRLDRRAETDPDPQSNTALDDRLNARLAALQQTSPAPSAGTAIGAPVSLWRSAPATVSGPGAGGVSPVALTRGGGGGSAPLSLARGPGRDAAPALATLPAVAHQAEEAPAHSGESTARRSLAGVTLMGPIADRPILSQATPVYPDWARSEAVEGSVTLYFVVRADGTVKENVLVQKTAGFEDFDDNARTAIRAWRFAALKDGRTGEQWGTVTFHFRLRSGN